MNAERQQGMNEVEQHARMIESLIADHYPAHGFSLERAALRASTRALRRGGWRPIETAPAHGYAFVRNGEQIAAVFWGRRKYPIPFSDNTAGWAYVSTGQRIEFAPSEWHPFWPPSRALTPVDDDALIVRLQHVVDHLADFREGSAELDFTPVREALDALLRNRAQTQVITPAPAVLASLSAAAPGADMRVLQCPECPTSMETALPTGNPPCPRCDATMFPDESAKAALTAAHDEHGDWYCAGCETWHRGPKPAAAPSPAEPVVDVDVALCLDALIKMRGTYANEVPIEADDVRAALECYAALTAAKAAPESNDEIDTVAWAVVEREDGPPVALEYTYEEAIDWVGGASSEYRNRQMSGPSYRIVELVPRTAAKAAQPESVDTLALIDAARTQFPECSNAMDWMEQHYAITMVDSKDGCTERNCKRCNTAPYARGDMPHAGLTARPAESAARGAVDALPAKWRSDARRYGNEDEAAVANSCADELTAALAQQPDGPRSGVDCSREGCRLDGRLPCASESCPQREPDGPGQNMETFAMSYSESEASADCNGTKSRRTPAAQRGWAHCGNGACSTGLRGRGQRIGSEVAAAREA